MNRFAALLVIALASMAGCLDGGETTDAPEEQPGQTPSEGAAPANQTDLWGNPSERVLRPGVNMVTDGASCTTSFVFEYAATYYMATASHCVSPDGLSSECAYTPLENVTSTLIGTDGTEFEAPVAYHAWSTMADVGESDANTCQYNDFALVEIAPGHVPQLHPASLHFRAPTALNNATLSQGDDVWGYGASILKQGVSQSHPKQGTYLGLDGDGWSHHVYLATPGIPGDSGGHIMTRDGQALGIASTVTLAPTTGSNHYTDIAKSLEYMEAHLGWAPELVSWDDFNASLA